MLDTASPAHATVCCERYGRVRAHELMAHSSAVPRTFWSFVRKVPLVLSPNLGSDGSRRVGRGPAVCSTSDPPSDGGASFGRVDGGVGGGEGGSTHAVHGRSNRSVADASPGHVLCCRCGSWRRSTARCCRPRCWHQPPRTATCCCGCTPPASASQPQRSLFSGGAVEPSQRTLVPSCDSSW